MIQIYFNSQLMNLSDFDGTEGISFVFRKKTETGESGLSFAPELTLTGDAYQFIRTEIISQPNPSLASILVEVYDECCENLLFDGIIRGSDIRWCEIPNCSCTVTIIDNSEDTEAIKCLKNTLIWDRVDKADGSGISSGEDTFRNAPFLTYCTDVRPSLLQELIMIYGIMHIFAFAPVLAIIAVLVTAINAIISIVGGNPIGGDISFIDDVQDLIFTIQRLVVGCGKKHKAPFIHSYLQNMCDICGLTLSSSIFNPGGNYHNAMRLDAPYKPGGFNAPKILNHYEKNKPNLNGIQFLEEFKAFNIDWKATNGVLYVERKDFLSSGLWFDVTVLNQEDVIELCYEPTETVPAAYAEYDYIKDGVDNTSDEVLPDWGTVVDWNIPLNDVQVGALRKIFNYSTAQFRKDANRDDISSLDKPIYSFFIPLLNEYNNVMLIERGICAFPRLLQWDGISPLDDARVKRYIRTSDTYDYNVDWWINENYLDGNNPPVSHETLYQRFLFIDDPRITTIKTKKYTLILNANCGVLNTLSLDGFIIIPQGGTTFEASVEEVNFNYSQNTLTITGKY